MAFPLPPATPWRPSLFLRLSAALHGLALLAMLFAAILPYMFFKWKRWL